MESVKVADEPLGVSLTIPSRGVTPEILPIWVTFDVLLKRSPCISTRIINRFQRFIAHAHEHLRETNSVYRNPSQLY